MLIMTLMLYTTAIIFIVMNHPLMMGFTLMLSSMIYGVMLYLLNSSSWFIYILVMIFVSGVMVMFIYMSSLSSNEPMTFSFTTLYKMNFIFLMMSPLFILTKQLKTNYLTMNLMNQMFFQSSMNLIYKTYNKILLEMTILLTIYLLVVLIVAMKIVNNFKMPLRSKK